ncbi:hypothetical protein D3C72_556340 [compost metagenome]
MGPICVLIVPSLVAGEWRARIAEAGEAAGWQTVFVGERLDDSIDLAQSILISESVTAFETFSANQVHVIHAAAEDIVELLSRMDPAAREYVVGRASIYLANAEALVREGAHPTAAPGILALGRGIRPIALEAPPHVPPGYLGMFDAMPAPPVFETAWPAKLFRYAPNRTPASEPGTIELVGPPRVLVFGPYIHLPQGRWDLTIEMEVDIDDMPITLAMAWGDHFDHPAASLRFRRSGRYRLDFSAEFQPTRPAELRISLPNALLHGQIRMEKAKLSRRS